MGMILKRIVSCLIVVCLTAAMLAGLTNLTESKSSLEKYTQFFDQKADFDVLFMGSSKVINAILPMELWNDYGIVSYNMGGHANTIPTSYWVLRNALDYTTPKCVVFDCMGTAMTMRISNHFDYSHLSFDAFPLSPTKIQAVFDLVDPEEWEYPMIQRMELLWNFSIYHSRWTSLGREDFHPSFTHQKGAEPRINVSVPHEMASVSPDAKFSPDSLGIEYLIKAIELCQERDIEILLILVPYPGTEGDLMAANTVTDIAEKYGVEYINFFNMDVVNYQTDMHDPDSHLNPSGARKITDYLGRILSQQYGIPNQRENADYQSWHDDAEKYHMEKIRQFEDTTSVWNYWMLLSDDDFSFLAKISEQDLQQDNTLADLLRNAGVQPENVQGTCIIAADRSSGTVEYIPYETLLHGTVETALGSLSMDGSTVKLDALECWQEQESQSNSLSFALLNTDRTLVGTACFSPDAIRPQESD